MVVWGRQLEVWTAGLGKAFHLRSERKVAQLRVGYQTRSLGAVLPDMLEEDFLLFPNSGIQCKLVRERRQEEASLLRDSSSFILALMRTARVVLYQ